MINKRSANYLRRLSSNPFAGSERTGEILAVNPTIAPLRQEAEHIHISVHDYNADTLEIKEYNKVDEAFRYLEKETVSWINIDGIRKEDIESICAHYSVHALITEDILSIGQRPKMDEMNEQVFCLLNMLYFNEEKKTIESEQISIILGKGFVLSFQEDAHRDVFNPIRHKLSLPKSQLRQRSADYLLYSMLDLIVDNYYLVMEKVGDQVENLEDEVSRKSNKRSLARINQLRKEMIVIKRNVSPVRDLVAGILRSESDWLEERTTKYFKDVHDHILLAVDLSDNYRDVMISVQDLYISNVNLKLNEVMKVMTIVTCLLAPATVIGGIFGMNFDVIPTAHHPYGFYIAIGLMFIIPGIMLVIMKKRGWF
ncbi:MAG: magnesium/cobalt transporter CorA [Bacteroidota bacterium]|jgi:magnesium transporter